jgi:hypothetical protein
MKLLRGISLLALASSMALAQTGSGSGQAQNSNVADELKALREAIVAQQAQIAQQQQQMTQQQKQIETLQQALDAKTTVAPHVENAALTTNTVPTVAVAQADVKKPTESPLSFRIGGTDFTPGGFVDFGNVFRSTNTGGNLNTGYGSIPYSNTVQGHLTEFRSTGQYSRFNLKIAGKYGANNVVGYIESDFNGNDAANVFVTSNSHTMRLRLYWVDLRRGKWEILGGQAWGMLTPNRTGVSPYNADLATTFNADANIQVGINYTRAGQFRAVYHPNDNFAWGFGLENPEQFVGAGEVIFPFAFNAALGPQFDAANNTATPNAFPDIVTKMAYDTKAGGRNFHIEAGAIMTSVKATVVPIGGTTFVHHAKTGGGVQGAFNFELVKNFRVLGNALYGNGVGRYMIGLGPQAVVVPIALSPTTFDVNPSLVRALDGLGGVELQAGPKTQFGAYYGGVYFKRNAFPDVTSPLVTKPIIGFGGINSPNSANRAIQEGTFDWTQTFWKNPQYGAVNLVTQWSYVTRAPWFVPAGAPKNAHLGMAFVSLRYIIP